MSSDSTSLTSVVLRHWDSLDAPASALLPSGQVVQSSDACALSNVPNLPDGQFLHASAAAVSPFFIPYFPATQPTHATALSVLPHCPFGHRRQFSCASAASTVLYLPASQGLQVDTSVARFVVEYLPATHATQSSFAVAPSVVPYRPLEHDEHSFAGVVPPSRARDAVRRSDSILVLAYRADRARGRRQLRPILAELAHLAGCERRSAGVF